MKNSNILKIKSQFFLSRALIYSSFLLLPIWLPSVLSLTLPFKVLMLLLYILFMIGQWFLLGKEIDYRFKIYYRVNSSMDRFVYRLLMGCSVMTLYFYSISIFSDKILSSFFWGTWIVLGLFYSWPTRGKIIEDTMSKQLNEFRFLDPFERTVLGMILFLFIISIPPFPSLESVEALRLYFDPYEKMSPIFWNFLNINYLPFKESPQMDKLAWCLHFYVVGMGGFLLTVYAFLRFFVGKRLSMLGVFAVISSWSFSKILGQNLGVAFSSTFSVLWIWSLLWSARSSTYRFGLFLGILGYWGTLINRYYFWLLLLQIALLYFIYLKNKTLWYRRQFVKYTLFGFILSLGVFLFNSDFSYPFDPLKNTRVFKEFSEIISRKAFFSLGLIGIPLLTCLAFNVKLKFVQNFSVEVNKVREFFTSFLLLFCFAWFFEKNIMSSFSLMWVIAFFGLIPLESIFQTISRLRSKRNFIYAVYFLICLLDSHIEGRIKLIFKLFS